MENLFTKTGNTHVRRLLIESAWSARRPQVGERLAQRQHGQDPLTRARAWCCQHRLYRRWQRMAARGKPHQKFVAAPPVSSPASSGRSPPTNRYAER
jgi:transposase